MKSNVILVGGLRELRAVANLTFNPASCNLRMPKFSALLIFPARIFSQLNDTHDPAA
jgi:hypothetical protein